MMQNTIDNLKTQEYETKIETVLLEINENDSVEEHNEKTLRNMVRIIYSYHMKLQLAINHNKKEDEQILSKKIDTMTDAYYKVQEAFIEHKLNYKLKMI